MHSNLKKEIGEMVQALKEEEKVNLARQIEENWDKTCLEYSKSINTYYPDRPMEKILERAFISELKRIDYSNTQSEKIVDYLKKHRILQTGPHVFSCVNVPRFFFGNWLASLSLLGNQFYPVAMFSGIPFSNKTRPGRICYEGVEINLIPSTMQDALVYRNIIPVKMTHEIKKLPDEIRKKLPEAKVGNSYTKWASQSSRKIEEKKLNGQAVFFDFNEVVSNYLILAIEESEHPISKMLFSPKERKFAIKSFRDVVFFYAPVKKGKYEEMENFYLRDGYLEGMSRRIELKPEILKKELRGKFCPGMIIGFFIIAFLNRFRCFGSFAQPEYMSFYRDELAKLPFLKKYQIHKAPLGIFTTGGFPGNVDLRALDIKDETEILTKYKNILFGETSLAIKHTLLHKNYSMNLIRK